MAVRRRCGPTTVPRASVPAVEPLQAALARIAAQGDGPVLAHKRL